jgi:hypothetical protein
MSTIKRNLSGLAIAAALSMASMLLLAEASMAAVPDQASSQQEQIGSVSQGNAS